MAKNHLKKVLGNAVLTYEELATVLTRAEAAMNSRSLFTQPATPNEISAITPGHFLTGRMLIALPEPLAADSQANLLNRWKFIQHLFQVFWSRWSKEYLQSLQSKSKWRKTMDNLQIGDVVIIKSAMPQYQWRMGRVCGVYLGIDDLVRFVDHCLSGGSIIKRNITSLILVPREPANRSIFL